MNTANTHPTEEVSELKASFLNYYLMLRDAIADQIKAVFQEPADSHKKSVFSGMLGTNNSTEEVKQYTDSVNTLSAVERARMGIAKGIESPEILNKIVKSAVETGLDKDFIQKLTEYANTGNQRVGLEAMLAANNHVKIQVVPGTATGAFKNLGDELKKALLKRDGRIHNKVISQFGTLRAEAKSVVLATEQAMEENKGLRLDKAISMVNSALSSRRPEVSFTSNQDRSRGMSF